MSTQLVRTDPVVAGILDGQRTFAGPEHVVIDITNRCNYNCVACWTFSPLLGDKKPPKAWYGQELPGRMLRDLLDDLAAMGTKLVRFTGGGEPFLHPQILPLIAHCASVGLRLDITTNGSQTQSNSITKPIASKPITKESPSHTKPYTIKGKILRTQP